MSCLFDCAIKETYEKKIEELEALLNEHKEKYENLCLKLYSYDNNLHNNDSIGTLSLQEVAKILKTGRTRLCETLRNWGVFMPDGTIPYQKYMDDGYFILVVKDTECFVGSVPVTRVTEKGLKYLERYFNRFESL